VGAATAGNGSGCTPGAVGAVVGELAAKFYNPTGTGDKADTVAFAQTMATLAGALVANGTGENIGQAGAIAGATGENSAANNWLIHAQQTELTRLQEKCSAAKNCSSEEQGRIQELMALAKKPYYSGKKGQATQFEEEATLAYTGQTSEQLSKQRDADQATIDAQHTEQSKDANAKVWANFQESAQAQATLQE
jgi:hypothetical protein